MIHNNLYYYSPSGDYSGLCSNYFSVLQTISDDLFTASRPPVFFYAQVARTVQSGLFLFINNATSTSEAFTINVRKALPVAGSTNTYSNSVQMVKKTLTIPNLFNNFYFIPISQFDLTTIAQGEILTIGIKSSNLTGKAQYLNNCQIIII